METCSAANAGLEGAWCLESLPITLGKAADAMVCT